MRRGRGLKTHLYPANNGTSQGTISGMHFKVSPVRDNEGSKEGKTKGEQNDEPHTYVFRG